MTLREEAEAMRVENQKHLINGIFGVVYGELKSEYRTINGYPASKFRVFEFKIGMDILDKIKKYYREVYNIYLAADFYTAVHLVNMLSGVTDNLQGVEICNKCGGSRAFHVIVIYRRKTYHGSGKEYFITNFTTEQLHHGAHPFDGGGVIELFNSKSEFKYINDSCVYHPGSNNTDEIDEYEVYRIEVYNTLDAVRIIMKRLAPIKSIDIKPNFEDNMSCFNLKYIPPVNGMPDRPVYLAVKSGFCTVVPEGTNIGEIIKDLGTEYVVSSSKKAFERSAYILEDPSYNSEDPSYNSEEVERANNIYILVVRRQGVGYIDILKGSGTIINKLMSKYTFVFYSEGRVIQFAKDKFGIKFRSR